MIAVARRRRPTTAPLWLRGLGAPALPFHVRVKPSHRRDWRDRDPHVGHRSAAPSDRGSVTAEIAVALPALVLVTSAALWGVTIAAAQLACIDAVRSGARAAARGEPLSAVRAVVSGAVPAGATVAVHRDGDLTRVEVSSPVQAPGFTGLPSVTLRARALAATEPGSATR